VAEVMLDLVDVHAGYGRIEVLHGVDLAVRRGSVLALLGPNGAGKTTLLKVVSGQLRATSGHVHLAGVHVNDAAPDELARAGLCTVPEGRGVFPNLTVAENLRLTSYVGGEVDVDRVYERFPRLAERSGRLAGSLSGGEQQMLAMARALVTDPVVLLVDELSMGLGPLVVRELYDVVGGMAQAGATVLLVEQFAETALALADRAAVLSHGVVVGYGAPEEIRADLSGHYLGGQVR